METIMYMIGFDRDFIKRTQSGWGCGYVCIPVGHPYYEVIAPVNVGYHEESYTDYPQVGGFAQEINYNELKVINGVNYRVIGFDCAHSWHNDKHDFDYVFSETLKLKTIVDNYKQS